LWKVPHNRLEWAFEWAVYGLRQSAIVELFQLLASFSIAAGAISYCAGADDRNRQTVINAWEVIARATGQARNGARDQMLELLAAQGRSLARIDLTRAQLEAIDLRGADLRGAVLTSANLTRARLGCRRGWVTPPRCTDLTGATLVGASLDNASLAGATLSWANLSGATLLSADLTRADLGGAQMIRGTLRGADLTEADLSDARMTYADLRYATLSRALLNRATLDSVDLRSSCLAGTHWGAPAFESRPRGVPGGLYGFLSVIVRVIGRALDRDHQEVGDIVVAVLAPPNSMVGARINDVRLAPSAFGKWASQHGARQDSSALGELAGDLFGSLSRVDPPTCP